MDGTRQLLVWQLIDSAFPTGGFAHSLGLEAAHQMGLVCDAASLRAFVLAALDQAAHQSLPLVAAVHADPRQFASCDRLAHAMLTCHVASEASRAQGMALLASAEACFGNSAVDSTIDLGTLRQEIRATQRRRGELASSRLHGHQAPVFGVVCRAVGMDAETTQRAYMFQALRTLVSAAVRLGIAGPAEAQRLQAECAPAAERARAACARLSVDEACSTTPLADAMQAAHPQLFQRLFSS